MKTFALIFMAVAFALTGISGAVGLASAFTNSDSSQAKIVELEKRIAELECRHVMFEDGSTLHRDAEAVAECVYTAPVYARYGG